MTAVRVLAAVVVLFVAHPAAAQFGAAARQTPRAGSWEIGGSVTWAPGFTGPERAAELTRNEEAAGGFDLFTTEGEVASAAGIGATLAYYLSPAVALEGELRYGKPRLTYRLSGDAEDAADTTAEETMTRYIFSGSLVLHLRGLEFGSSGVPYLLAGAGHLRDLHEGDELVETGTEYHVAAGIKYWFGTAGPRFGLRGQAGISMTDGGFDLRRDRSRTVPIASASLIYLF